MLTDTSTITAITATTITTATTTTTTTMAQLSSPSAATNDNNIVDMVGGAIKPRGAGKRRENGVGSGQVDLAAALAAPAPNGATCVALGLRVALCLRVGVAGQGRPAVRVCVGRGASACVSSPSTTVTTGATASTAVTVVRSLWGAVCGVVCNGGVVGCAHRQEPAVSGQYGRGWGGRGSHAVSVQ